MGFIVGRRLPASQYPSTGACCAHSVNQENHFFGSYQVSCQRLAAWLRQRFCGRTARPVNRSLYRDTCRHSPGAKCA